VVVVEAEIVMVQKYYLSPFFCYVESGMFLMWNDVPQQYGIVQYYRYTHTYHSSEKPDPVSVQIKGI
jgi:hypothetical protein